MNNLAYRVKELRREKGLYQGELAQMIGMSRSTIAMIENGNTYPGREKTIQKIANALDISVSCLYKEPRTKIPINKRRANIIGIYIIKNIINNMIYIGASKNVRLRISAHFYLLKNNDHFNSEFQKDYNEYGQDCFSTEIIECAKDKLIDKERREIFKHNNVYNKRRSITKDVAHKVGALFRSERKRRKITQKQLSKYLGIPQPKMSMIEGGKIVNNVQYKKIADFFGIDIEYVISEFMK